MTYLDSQNFKLFYQVLRTAFGEMLWEPNGKSRPSTYWQPPQAKDVDCEVLVTQPVADIDLPDKDSVGFAVDCALRYVAADKAIEAALSGTEFEGIESPLLLRGGKLTVSQPTYLNVVIVFPSTLNAGELATALAGVVEQEIWPKWQAVIGDSQPDIAKLCNCSVSEVIACTKYLGHLLASGQSMSNDSAEDVQRLLSNAPRSTAIATNSHPLAKITADAEAHAIRKLAYLFKIGKANKWGQTPLI
jgi:hypothetical protein